MRTAALALIALTAASCGDTSSYIIIELDGNRPLAIATVDITLKNANQTSTVQLKHDPDITVPPAKTFALKMDPDRRGDVEISLIARDRSAGEIGRWSGMVMIAPGRSVSVRANLGGDVVADMGTDASDLAMGSDLAMPDLAMPDLWHRRTLSFAPAVFYGQAAGQIAVADLNRDKVVDVVVTVGNAVDVLLGVGDGTLRNPVRYGVGQILNGIAVGDLNADGALDLALSDRVCCQFWTETMLGNGDGTFQPAQKYSLSESSTGVAMADLNGDRRTDVILGHGAAGVGVSLAGVDGKIKAETLFSLPMGNLLGLFAADLNRDGNMDVAILDFRAPGIAVFAGDGSGMLAPAILSKVLLPASNLAIADMNGDGNPDAVFTSNKNVEIAAGTGDGRFMMPWSTFEGTGPNGLVVSDLDSDGLADVAVTDLDAGNVAVFPGKGDGTLSGAIRFATGSKPGPVASADLNGDGLRDLILTSSSNGQTRVAVLLNMSM